MEHLDERLRQVQSVEAYLMTALAHLPGTVHTQRQQMIGQFDALRAIVELNQARCLEGLAEIERTVASQLQQELISCASHRDDINRIKGTYPQSVANTDVNHWLSAEDIWRSRLTVASQHGVLGAFSSHVAAEIPAPRIEYDGHLVDFSALWAVSRDASITQTLHSKPPKPLHFLLHFGSGFIRRWDYRDRVIISELNHPGVRSWSMFERNSKLVAASAKIRVYDSFTGACLAQFDTMTSPAKKVIASGSDLKARALSFHVNSGAAALWDLSQNTKVNWEMDISNWNTNIAVSVGGDAPQVLIPTMAFPFDVLSFNLITGDVDEKFALQGFQSDVIDIVPFGGRKGKSHRFCATLCSGGAGAIWDLATQKVLTSFQFDMRVQRLALAPRNKALGPDALPTVGAYSQLSGAFSVYHPATNQLVSVTHMNSTLLTSATRSLMLFDNGLKAISCHSNGKVHLWTTLDGQWIGTIPLSTAGSPVLCNHGHSIVVGSPNGYLNVIDTETLSVQQLIPSVSDGSGIQAHLL